MKGTWLRGRPRRKWMDSVQKTMMKIVQSREITCKAKKKIFIVIHHYSVGTQIQHTQDIIELSQKFMRCSLNVIYVITCQLVLVSYLNMGWNLI